MEPLTPKGRAAVAAASAVTGLTLTYGFLPTSRSLAQWVPPAWAHGHADALAFPILAAFFHVSLVERRTAQRAPWGWREAIQTYPLAWVISAAYGWFHRMPSVFELGRSSAGRASLLWFLVCIPIGEELLFRGWLQGVAERITRGRVFTETNPLPVSLWVSAIAFSLWHLQNAESEGAGLVAFQVLYTFFTGLWLGFLRWRTGRILPCVVAHFGLNLASNLW